MPVCVLSKEWVEALTIELSYSFRDLTVIDLPNGEVFLIACDSLGGVGSKPQDALQVSGEIVGLFTARVPLMEIIAAGAKPIALINTLSVEMDPTGLAIIKGIKTAIKDAGLDESIMITGSTEENFLTVQTGVGITVLGRAKKEELRLGTSVKGNLVVCLGVPQVGGELLEGLSYADIPLVKRVLEVPGVREILPVGSKGILYEARELAKCAKLSLKLLNDVEVDLTKSAGPASCILVSLAEEFLPCLISNSPIPVFKIGYLVY